MVHGSVAPEFEEVRVEFQRNFTERADLGAACAIYYQGEKVVDLWGGYRNAKTQDPWQEDTLVCVFSTTKGMAAMAMAVAHSQRLFNLDEPVSSYWPEFAQRGKARITVRQLLSHQAGLSAVDEPMNPHKMADLDFMAAAIAKQKPAWNPGSRHGYHGLSLGWYQNELIRRIDPAHRSLGRFFQEEIARPLGVEFYIGLPSDVPASRIATIQAFHPLRMVLHLDVMPTAIFVALMCPWSLTSRSLMNPKMRTPGEIAGPAYRTVEFPSAAGIGHARGIARAYSVFATGARELGIEDDTLNALTAVTAPTLGRRDLVLKVETAYSFGFWKPCPAFRFGSSEKAFGGHGAGGSFGFADPDLQIGYAYVMNKMGFHLFDDPRELALRQAMYRCVERTSGNIRSTSSDRG